MTILCWLVVDDSGSMAPFKERAREVHDAIRDELECFANVRSWTASSSYGMTYLTDRPIGSGGGDGLRHMFDMPYGSQMPSFIVYLTDDSAHLTPDTIKQIENRQVLLVDVTDPRWKPDNINQTLIQLHDFLVHDCTDDCFECCEDDFENGAQPFYPNWSSFKAPKSRVRKVYKHPVDTDLDAISRSIDECVSKPISVRTALGCELNDKIKKIVGGNTLTPTQHVRINCVKYRILMVCFDMAHKAAMKIVADAIVNNNNTHINNDTHNEVQEGQPMSQITTTVTLRVAASKQATVGDLKTLIAEVERVGGTDDSYINLEHVHARGVAEAIVVKAVEVTEPELDPRVACALAIKDTAARVSALVDLLHEVHSPTVREQIKQVLMGNSQQEYDAEQAKKATAKATKTTAARKGRS